MIRRLGASLSASPLASTGARRRLPLACSAAALALLAGSCVRNPVTGKLQLDLIPEGQEVAMGQQAADEVAQTIGIYKEKPELGTYIEALGQKLKETSPRKQLPFQFHIVDDAAVNAFALPGGPVFVTRGILGYVNSEAELASVMGHEIGHISARHSATQMSKAEVAQLGLGIGSILSPTIAGLGQAAGAGLQLLFLKFSREAENQADQLGFQSMTEVGYDPRTMGNLFVTLERVSGGQGRLPEYLATHPDPANRLENTKERLAALKKDLSGSQVLREEYLARIDGIAFGEDPRQGYFKGTLFLHPGLKFQLQLPEGWQTQNTPQAVAAQSPAKDAIFQLQPAGKDSPEDAATKFLGQQGLQAGPATRGDVNGNPAVTAQFAAQTQQGVIEGLVTFLSFKGATYGMLAYAPQGKMAQYADTVKRSMGSFRELTDATALAVQPARLKIVKVDHDMSLEQFNSAHPSNLDLEELSIINGIEKGGTLKGGQSYKRVVGGPPREAKAGKAAQK